MKKCDISNTYLKPFLSFHDLNLEEGYCLRQSESLLMKKWKYFNHNATQDSFNPQNILLQRHMAIAAFQNFSVGVDAGPTFDLPVDTGSVWL